VGCRHNAALWFVACFADKTKHMEMIRITGRQYQCPPLLFLFLFLSARGQRAAAGVRQLRRDLPPVDDRAGPPDIQSQEGTVQRHTLA